MSDLDSISFKGEFQFIDYLSECFSLLLFQRCSNWTILIYTKNNFYPQPSDKDLNLCQKDSRSRIAVLGPKACPATSETPFCILMLQRVSLSFSKHTQKSVAVNSVVLSPRKAFLGFQPSPAFYKIKHKETVRCENSTGAFIAVVNSKTVDSLGWNFSLSNSVKGRSAPHPIDSFFLLLKKNPGISSACFD